MDLREIRGKSIAANARIRHDGERWFVPKQSGHGSANGTNGYYVVKPDISNPHCDCEDHLTNGKKCKHIWAVEFRLQEGNQDVEEQITFDDAILRKPTYKQEWSAYNAAQTNEKEQFQSLLRELCTGIGEPSHKNG